MNRFVLKIIALVAMLIDHIGYVFFPNYVIFRLIGRIAFPIFAYFIAEGWFYTRSKKKYVLLMLIFTAISWVPFNLALDLPMYTVNIFGIFSLSLLGMFLIDNIRKKDKLNTMYWSLFCFYLLIVFVIEALSLIPEGILGVLLPVIFYAFRNKRKLQMLYGGLILFIMGFTMVPIGEKICFADFKQFFALLALIPLYLYNGEKGKLSLKYLFYSFYPIHLILIWLLKIIIF